MRIIDWIFLAWLISLQIFVVGTTYTLGRIQKILSSLIDTLAKLR